MRGGKPLPTVVKQIPGTLRRDRVRADEPQPTVPTADAFDTPPAELEGDTVACAEWTRLAPVLRAARQVTEADRPALVAACLEWSRYLRTYRLADRDGLVTVRGSGGIGSSAYAVTAHRSL
jgi:phage terminase small subunit